MCEYGGGGGSGGGGDGDGRGAYILIWTPNYSHSLIHVHPTFIKLSFQLQPVKSEKIGRLNQIGNRPTLFKFDFFYSVLLSKN
jgi:hypothetical protein